MINGGKANLHNRLFEPYVLAICEAVMDYNEMNTIE